MVKVVQDKEYYRKYYADNREYRLNHYKKWYADNIERERLKRKDFNLKRRKEIIELYGGKCIKCGFSDCRSLHMDHVNGGGNKERKCNHSPSYYYNDYKESFSRGDNKYQLLCANCNWIKRYEEQELSWEKR